MTQKTATLEIGTAGYQYEHWRGRFYPDDLDKNKWMAHYCSAFSTVEINSTFYSLPSAETFRRWKEEMDSDFCFALKFSRYGTHLKKLKDPEQTADHFLSNAVHLGNNLGPILIQLPPNWKANPKRLDDFLGAFPRRQRLAVEFRDSSWLCRSVYEILKKHNSALCIHDKIDNHPQPDVSDWLYFRFHGNDSSRNYSYQKLTAVAEQLAKKYRQGYDIHVYFNNDKCGYAVNNARDLKRYLKKRISG